MTKPVRTSLTISFSSNLGGNTLQLEVDSRVDGHNSGRTQFYPGDTVYLLEYKTNDVSIQDRFCTDGGVVALGTGLMEITEFVSIAGSKTGNTSKPIASGLSITRSWGRPVSLASYQGTTLTLVAETVAVLEVRYTTTYTLLRLSGSSGDAPVLVYVMGIVE